MIRMAGHDLMDLRMDYYGNLIGGSDGCVNFFDPDNDGLTTCLINFGYLDIYNHVCHRISLADFLVVAAEAAMIATDPDYDENDTYKEGSIAWNLMKNFKFGRKTNLNCKEAAGTLPAGTAGCEGP